MSGGRLFVGFGVRKLRITGGEPLLWRGLQNLIERLARLTGDDGKPVEVALTTNGVIAAARWRGRNDRYSQLRHVAMALPASKIEMSYIGG